ncbi:DUF504 domain-containing protein [Candidatus Woesearchaeota archaeon]|nr:DUF504 domain-containing protein [Candidatus Woesearchaeota archaeon]
MQAIFELLNKIKWKEKDKEKFIIYYKDRFKEELQEIKFTDIKELNKFSIVLELDNKEVEIPLHRIRKVYKIKCVFGEE